jgi:hypothetical protein
VADGLRPPAARSPRLRVSRGTRARVQFRNVDQDVLRSLPGLRPHPLPPLRGEGAFVTAGRGGEGVEELKEAGVLRPPASLKTSPLPRPNPHLRRLVLAGGGVRGGGQARPRPSGLSPRSTHEAAETEAAACLVTPGALSSAHG